MRRAFLALPAILLILALGVAWAADSAKVTVDIKNATLSDAVAQLSKAANTTILVDGDIVRSGVTLSLNEAPIETALAAITTPQQLAWERLYVKTDADKQKPLKGEDLANMVRQLEAMESLGLVAVDGKTNLSTIYLRNASMSADQLSNYSAPTSGFKVIYLIMDPKKKLAANKTPSTSDYISGQQQYFSALKQMTPEQANAFWQQQSQLMNSLDRDSQVNLMANGIRMMINKDPQDVQQMMMEAFGKLTPDEQSALRGMGGGGGGPR